MLPSESTCCVTFQALEGGKNFLRHLFIKLEDSEWCWYGNDGEHVVGLKIFSTLITAHGFSCFSLEPSDGLTMLPQFHMWPVEGRSTAPMLPSQQVGSTSSKKNPAGLRRKSELTECYGCCFLRSQNPADCTGLLRKQCQAELWKPWFSAKTFIGIKIPENKPLEGSGISDNI